MRQANPKLMPRSFPAGLSNISHHKASLRVHIFGPIYTRPGNRAYPILASAAETEPAPSPASRTYIMKRA